MLRDIKGKPSAMRLRNLFPMGYLCLWAVGAFLWSQLSAASPPIPPARPFVNAWHNLLPTEQSLNSITLTADARTGVAVGQNGTILRTQDGGETWRAPAAGSGTQAYLAGVHFADARTGVAVGQNGTILRAGPPVFAPYLDRSENTATNGGKIRVAAWLAQEEGGAHTDFVALQIKSGAQEWSGALTLKRPAQAGGSWTIEVDPASYSIAPDSVIALRLLLQDISPPLVPFDLEPIRWKHTPIWEEWKATIVATAGALTLMLLYVACFGAMLLSAPRRLAGFGGTSNLAQLPMPTGTAGFVVGLLRNGMDSLAIPWFVVHPRVRRAWVAAYRNTETTLDDLGKLARPDFVKSADFLDAWVESQLAAAQAALAKLDLVRSRRIYVALPIRVDDPEAGRLIEKPEPANLREAFSRRRSVVAIVGGGGTGKSTLSCAIARWAMSNDPGERLRPHRMLPVFVLEDSINLLQSVENALRAMLPGCDLPPDLLAALLEQQRLLVIVDALSERSEATQQHIETLYQMVNPFNALLVTTRRAPDMGLVERTLFYPEPLVGKRLVPFIMDYLDRRKQDAAFDDVQAIELSGRVLALVNSDARLTTATPLLAFLFVESAVERVRRGQSLDGLPNDVPEVFRDYVRRVNPEAGPIGKTVAQDLMQQAAGILAMCSLGEFRVPSDFERPTAIARLAERGLLEAAEHLLDQAIANGLVEQRDVAGVKLLRFALDPAAEYLGALDRIRVLGKQRADWEAEFSLLRMIDGYPSRCEGYLQALGVCYRAYQRALQLPEFILPWESDLMHNS